jgi:hypothetical protein
MAKQTCTICGKPSIPGLKKGCGKMIILTSFDYSPIPDLKEQTDGAFREVTVEEYDHEEMTTVLTDMIADLLHLGNRDAENFDAKSLLDRAGMHFEAETGETK